jgi:hypothetical protein
MHGGTTIKINYIVFDMFRTTKCSSSGRLVHAVSWYFFMHPYKQYVRCQDTWLFEIFGRQYNLIKSLMKKMCIWLVVITYVNVRTHTQAALPSGMESLSLLNRRLSGLQSQSIQIRKERSLFPLLGIESRFLGRTACPVVHRLRY